MSSGQHKRHLSRRRAKPYGPTPAETDLLETFRGVVAFITGVLPFVADAFGNLADAFRSAPIQTDYALTSPTIVVLEKEPHV